MSFLRIIMALAPLCVPLLPPAAFAQNKVKTETIQVPPVSEEDAAGETAGEPSPADESPQPDAVDLPEVLYDTSLLPPPMQRMREQMIAAAKTGDIENLRPVVEVNELPPLVSFGGETDPIAFWRKAGGDPDGREIMAIMIEILESGFVRLEAGTPREIYVWPYFYALPLESLTPQQEVELYKLITPMDRQLMEEFGAYNFFRLGISPDGTWQYFVAGD